MQAGPLATTIPGTPNALEVLRCPTPLAGAQSERVASREVLLKWSS